MRKWQKSELCRGKATELDNLTFVTLLGSLPPYNKLEAVDKKHTAAAECGQKRKIPQLERRKPHAAAISFPLTSQLLSQLLFPAQVHIRACGLRSGIDPAAPPPAGSSDSRTDSLRSKPCCQPVRWHKQTCLFAVFNEMSASATQDALTVSALHRFSMSGCIRVSGQ